MGLFIVTIAGLAFLLMIGKLTFNYFYTKEINTLFNNQIDQIHQEFSYHQLEDLPIPVQKYFKQAIPEGYSYIRSVRLKHQGKFKISKDKKWKKIVGEQYYSINPPGFIWKGQIAPMTALDMFIKNKGRFILFLFDALKLIDKKGIEYDQGELLRWLGESVWFPTNLLPNNNLRWLPIDNNKAKLAYNYNNLSFNYIVHFNGQKEITQIVTERFYNGKTLTKWKGTCSHYKNYCGINIPTKIMATWLLPEEEFTYAKFHLTKIEYNIPAKF